MFLKIRISHLISVIVLSSIITAIICDNFIITNGLIADSFKGSISSAMLNKFLHIRNMYWWIGSLLSPLIALIKIIFVAGCLYIGSIIYYPNIKFNIFLKIALISEFIFIFYNSIKITLILFYKLHTIAGIQQFQPMTLYSLFDPVSIPYYLYYPFIILNLFEIPYWVIIVVLLKEIIKGSVFDRIIFIAKTYGMGLFIWITIVTFLTINFGA